MNSYELLGIGSNADRAELDAAYQSRRSAYDPNRLVGMGDELAALAHARRSALDRAYQTLRPALASPHRLAPGDERRRDRETTLAIILLAALALAMVLLRDIAVPTRTLTVTNDAASALQSRPAPRFELELLDGGRVSLEEQRGKVVLVNLWATWCPACVREAPRLQRVYERYQGQSFVVLAVNTTYQDDRAKVAQFVRDNGLTFPIPLDMDGSVGLNYSARLLPTSFLIDQRGSIVDVFVGEIDEQVLGERVEALLAAGAMPNESK